MLTRLAIVLRWIVGVEALRSKIQVTYVKMSKLFPHTFQNTIYSVQSAIYRLHCALSMVNLCVEKLNTKFIYFCL